VTHVQPVTHEAKAHLYYHPDADADYDGLDPYWALASLLIKHYDGYAELDDVVINGESWDLQLNYHESGIAPDREHDVDVERLYEFDLSVEGEGAERGGSYQFKPRFPDMRHYENADQITTPFDHLEADEGITVLANVSNMDPDEITALLPRFVVELFAEVDESFYHGYFDAPAGGRISEIERYVRLSRSLNQKLIKKGGIFDRLSMLLTGAKGVQGQYKFDNEDAVGQLHAIRMGPTGASELIPYHSYGRQIKSYLPENPEHFDADDALYHPKLGILFRKSLNRDRSIPWEQRHDLLEELDETIINSLEWAEIPTSPGGTVYVTDDHFTATSRDADVPTHEDPTPRLESKQEHLFMTVLRDVTPGQKSIIETLAADGGQDADDLAESAGVSISTLYRALQKLDGVIESDNGHIEFTTEKLAQEVRGIIQSAESAITNAADRAASILDADLRQSASSAFSQWLAEYGAEFEPPDSDGDRPTIRIDTVLSQFKMTSHPMLESALDEMLSAWDRDGRDVMLLRDAIVEVQVDGEQLAAPVATLH